MYEIAYESDDEDIDIELIGISRKIDENRLVMSIGHVNLYRNYIITSRCDISMPLI